VIAEIVGDRQLAAIERGVAHAVDALVRLDLEGDEVAAGQVMMTFALVIFMALPIMLLG
jgi:hypothetical protein